ncbi:hypothetical protein [Polaromonas eurypsychrophila]|uniref:Uncharacterized protein n=1 Tax=Polaromonas eurypsychrophila TaxID=1614635 RepID=A0A916SI25_9BURK|nr:hypothetical protein [Polaromonas eurypsychrophila]GGB01259.1 hypothetical protein GCM10011496_22720 [Polaromonas eurypsychrophila]
MNIHQMSVSYVHEQDRLLIRINGKEGGELRAWLTRRLALALLPILSQTTSEQIKKVAAAAVTTAMPAISLDDQRGRLLAAFETEAALRSGDFETPYQDRQSTPADPVLGPEPLLLTEVKVTLLGSGQLRLQLFEKLPGQEAVRNFQVMMDPKLSNGLLHLLHQSLNASQWLHLPVISPLEEVATTTEQADLSLDLSKPKYLN